MSLGSLFWIKRIYKESTKTERKRTTSRLLQTWQRQSSGKETLLFSLFHSFRGEGPGALKLRAKEDVNSTYVMNDSNSQEM